jgi:uncharacterized protein (UPF0335 family)
LHIVAVENTEAIGFLLERKMRNFDNKALRKILRSKRDDRTQDFGQLNNEDFIICIQYC